MSGIHIPFPGKAGLISAAIKAVARNTAAGAVGTPAAVPFITISREAGVGAGAHSLAQRLVAELNKNQYSDERSWETLDHETMDLLAKDQKLSAAVMESLEQTDHSWFSEFLEGLPGRDDATSELQVFHRTAAAIRTLAQAGRVVLVGGGAAYITRGMPNGTHIRIVAPKSFRVDTVSVAEHISMSEAAAKVDRLDRNRAAFFKRYWPERPLSAEQFTMTLNAAELSEEEMAAAIIAVVHG